MVFFMCSCIIFVSDRACLYCLFYQCLFSYLCELPFLSVCLFKRKYSVLWLSVYFSFPSMHSPIKLQELSIILFHPWTYFWYSIENTFLVLKIPDFAMTFRWKFYLGFTIIQQSQWHKHCFTPRMRKHKLQKSEFH